MTKSEAFIGTYHIHKRNFEFGSLLVVNLDCAVNLLHQTIYQVESQGFSLINIKVMGQMFDRINPTSFFALNFWFAVLMLLFVSAVLRQD
ncbi:hypothetical protein NIES2098_17000 [Calothrix sp. NIES-2098]|nr:hypothetical protein NIES2098_17000 [Calothrix sp. NIES-2098]